MISTFKQPPQSETAKTIFENLEMIKVIGMTVKKGISKTITDKFRKRYKSNISTHPMQTIPLSRDIYKCSNELLTMEVSDAKIFEAVNQINPLKSPVQIVCNLFSITKTGIL